jgi:8-oxo-dGTP pyrophosphatase MutT (NUDIX family)
MVKAIDSRVVYRNQWMTVREDAVVLDDGTAGQYGVVDKADFALVIPEAAGGLWLVEQFRYPVKRRAWEFPQGSWGEGGGGTQEELAAAELAEETGLRAAELIPLGHLYGAYGFCSQGFDVFLARGLRDGAPAREPSEQDMRHMQVTEAHFERMIATGEIVDSSTIAAYALLLLHRR